jgi:hypothetical protein
MPRFDQQFLSDAQGAFGIVTAGEMSRVNAATRKQWTPSRLESLYELAFLRVFLSWELCLEGLLFRSLCGYASSAVGQETPMAGTFEPTIATASSTVHGGQRYLAWHNPNSVLQRCRHHIRSGQQEAVIASHETRLKHFASIRHRIAHGQDDAKQKFNQTTLLIAGRTFSASSPGRFLRHVVPHISPKTTYLATILTELHGLMSQMI